MKIHMINIKLCILLVCLTFSSTILAAETLAGYGILYDAQLVFTNEDAKPGGKILSVKSGDILLPAAQKNSNITPYLIPRVKSSGWCDPSANPNTLTKEYENCFGWSMYSRWFLIDLSKVSSTVWVQINVSRYKDNDSDLTDDDLIPAMTIWRGKQSQGKFGDWYPNQFQGFDNFGKPLNNDKFKPFWAWTLSPLSNISTNASWSSALESSNQKSVTIIQKVVNKTGDQDYLTIALSGDDQLGGNLHDVNFQLNVRISSKYPVTDLYTEDTSIDSNNSVSGSGGQSSMIDTYGCTVNVTCWHPQMDHCMDIPLCDLAEYKGQCLCPVNKK